MRKEEAPEKDTIDRLRVKDVEFEKVRQTKSYTDDTKISHDKVTSEKVTVSRHDISKTEETEKPRYPKERDIGRIVIEEMPEEKKEIPKEKLVRKEDVKPKTTQLTVTRHHVEDDTSRHVKEDVVKVGKLDVTELDKTPKESRREEKTITTHEETVDGGRKVHPKINIGCFFISMFLNRALRQVYS